MSGPFVGVEMKHLRASKDKTDDSFQTIIEQLTIWLNETWNTKNEIFLSEKNATKSADEQYHQTKVNDGKEMFDNYLNTRTVPFR